MENEGHGGVSDAEAGQPFDPSLCGGRDRAALLGADLGAPAALATADIQSAGPLTDIFIASDTELPGRA